jgi:hypothetical protein
MDRLAHVPVVCAVITLIGRTLSPSSRVIAFSGRVIPFSRGVITSLRRVFARRHLSAFRRIVVWDHLAEYPQAGRS